MRKIIPAVLLSVYAFILPAALPERVTPYIIDRANLDKTFKSDRSSVVTGFRGEKARITEPGGEFSFKLNVDGSGTPQKLAVQYSGENGPAKGQNLLFRVLADDTPLMVQGLNRNLAQNFFEEYYRIPPELLKGKREVTITFRAYDEKCSVGEVYDAAVIRVKTDIGQFGDWKNYSARSVSVPGAIIFTEPDGPQAGTASQPVNDSVIDLMELYGLELEFSGNVEGTSLEVIASPERLSDKNLDSARDRRTIEMKLTGKKVIVPFAGFNTPASDSIVLRGIKSLAFRFAGAKGEKINLESVRLLPGLSFHAELPVRSKPCQPGQSVTYPMTLSNTEQIPQKLFLSRSRHGWEAMEVKIVPAEIELKPGEKAEVAITVTVAEKIPPGGREKQLIHILPSANPAASRTVELTTTSAMLHPFLIHTAAGWQEVREKAQKYQWAKDRAERYRVDANMWRPPKRAVYRISGDTRRPCLTSTTEEGNLMNTAIAWQLFRNQKYAAKVREFLLMISNPQDGYPVTRQAGNQSAVQEGHFFQHLAQAYDMIRDSGVLSEQDCGQIDATLRIFAEGAAKWAAPSGANWAVSSQTGAFFSALALQDFALVDHMLYAPSMLMDKFAAYTMSDGWWYECTVSYNLWCAEQFTQIALALNPFGYSLLEQKIAVNFLQFPDYKKSGKDEQHISRNLDHGHSFRIRGNIDRPFVRIKDMSEALLPFLDYRGWMFGMNDSTENRVGGGRFELAYYAFRDPRFAAFIKMEKHRDNLIYGVGELPENAIEIGKGSAYSDNAGVLMLRSTQKDPRERIQAVLKYGTHGGYHGHWDLTGLLSMMRYGRSFYNPEMVWYSYAPFMYAFYVQSSVSKNMVTVDLKQQEAADSVRRLFHTGELMQAGCVETTAAWSYPPYGGLRYTMGFDSFKAKTEAEARFMPTPENPPPFGVLTGFTEPVLQRRLMAVTDDYIVIADYLKGEQEHDFDLLHQIKGLRSISAPEKELSAHSAQLTDDPASAAQLITDINRYKVRGTAKAEFLTRFGKGADNAGTRISGEDGNLFINLHYAWPNDSRELFTGLAPEDHGTQRNLTWNVKGDGKILREGKFGAWILGDGKIDLDITGIKKLELSTAIEWRGRPLTIFWGEPVIETADGKTLKLSDLKPAAANVRLHNFGPNKDYGNGKINIAGHNYAFALPAEPAKTEEPAVYTYDLTGLNAVRLKAAVGGDYPVGNEAERRVTIGLKQHGKTARFLSIMEPFEKESVIAAVEAESADKLTVRLKDGRVHTFTLKNFDGDGKNITLEMSEEKDGQTRTESTFKNSL